MSAVVEPMEDASTIRLASAIPDTEDLSVTSPSVTTQTTAAETDSVSMPRVPVYALSDIQDLPARHPHQWVAMQSVTSPVFSPVKLEEAQPETTVSPSLPTSRLRPVSSL